MPDERLLAEYRAASSILKDLKDISILMESKVEVLSAFEVVPIHRCKDLEAAIQLLQEELFKFHLYPVRA